MLACLSRRRSRVQIPSGTLEEVGSWRSEVGMSKVLPTSDLGRPGTQTEKRRSSNLREFVGSTPTLATHSKSEIGSRKSVRTHSDLENASVGHWQASVAVTHSPSGFAGSTPARRTEIKVGGRKSASIYSDLRAPTSDLEKARSSIGLGHQPLTLKRWVRFPYGSLWISDFRFMISDWPIQNLKSQIINSLQGGRCPTDFHMVGVPGSIPGPATEN